MFIWLTTEGIDVIMFACKSIRFYDYKITFLSNKHNGITCEVYYEKFKIRWC